MLAPITVSLAARATAATTTATTEKMARVIHAAMRTGIHTGTRTESHPEESCPPLSQLSTLLRGHDAPPEYRHKRLAAKSTQAETIAQQCFLSDALSQALKGMPLNRSWIQSGQQQAQRQAADRGAMPAASRKIYQQIWTDIAALDIATLAVQTPNQPTQRLSTQRQIAQRQSAHHQAIIAGTAWIVAEPRLWRIPSNARLSWEAALVAGCLSGAISGRGALPALWQRAIAWGGCSLDPADAIALADTLFDNWAGRGVGQ